MRFRSTPQSSPEHWSKDYVEHLRTVHFALVSVSVGLILLLAPKSYDTEKAAAEMAALEKINPAFIRDIATEDQHPPESGSSDIIVDHASPTWLEAEPDQAAVKAEPQLSGRVFRFYLREPDLYACKHWQLTSLDPRWFPHTMQDVLNWWTSYLRPPEYWHISPEAEKTADKSLLNRALAITYVDKYKRIGDITSLDGTTLGKVNISRTSVTAVPAIELTLEGSCFAYGDTKRPPYLTGSDGLHHFKFHVTSSKSAGFSQDAIHFRLDDLRPGDFVSSFSDLIRASRGRLDVDFATLAPQVYAEAARGTEAFDAFGIKFPSEQVTRWGLVILLGVQLYFLMYLRRLYHKELKPSDPAWDVPWMAMDPSMLGKTMLLISVFVLPSCAASLVIVRTILPFIDTDIPFKAYFFGSLRLHPVLIVEYSLMLAGVIGSVVLSVLCWRYRPRVITNGLDTHVAPAQLFE